MLPSNATAVVGMRIFDFPHGNGIQLDGANSVQILRNVISGTAHAIDMVTVPHYAPNAVHVANNEIAGNDWAVYSHNGHVPATRALGNVYRDNVRGETAAAIYFSDGMRTRWWREIISSRAESRLPRAAAARTSLTFT